MYIECRLRYLFPNTPDPVEILYDDGRPILYYRVFLRSDPNQELSPIDMLLIFNRNMEDPRFQDVMIHTEREIPLQFSICWAKAKHNFGWPPWCRVKILGPIATLLLQMGQATAITEERTWQLVPWTEKSSSIEKWLDNVGLGPWESPFDCCPDEPLQ